MKNLLRRRLFIVLLGAGLWWSQLSCSRVYTPPPERLTLDSTLAVPPSRFDVLVYHPVAELEAIVNEKVPTKTYHVNLSLNDKEDSLFLSISRYRSIKLAYDGERGLTYTVPIKLSGFFHTRKVGINIRNKTPITAEVEITFFSELYLNSRWELVPRTTLKSIVWKEEPKINIAGIKFNLKPSLENALQNHQSNWTDKLDSTATAMVRTRTMFQKLWSDIHKPIAINRKVVPIWLAASAHDLAGRFVPRSTDTLFIEVTIEATLRTILDSASYVVDSKPLPPFSPMVGEGEGIDAYVLTTFPFTEINQVLAQATDSMRFKFRNKVVRIERTEAFGTSTGLGIRLRLAGDIKADVNLNGTIGFDTLERKVIIENFAFDMESEQGLMRAAEWLAHGEILDRIKPYLSFPVEKGFSALPGLITAGIEKGKLGQKIDLHFPSLTPSVDNYLVTSDNVQLILSARGSAEILLQKGLFRKKKKKPV